MIYIYVFQLDIGLSPNQAGVTTKQTNNRTLEHRPTKPCPKREGEKKKHQNPSSQAAKHRWTASVRFGRIQPFDLRIFFPLHEFLWPKYWLLDINNIPTARKKRNIKTSVRDQFMFSDSVTWTFEVTQWMRRFGNQFSVSIVARIWLPIGMICALFENGEFFLGQP